MIYTFRSVTYCNVTYIRTARYVKQRNVTFYVHTWLVGAYGDTWKIEPSSICYGAAVRSLRYVKIFTYHFSVMWKYLALRKIFTYVFAKRKMLTLRHVTLRYVKVENRQSVAFITDITVVKRRYFARGDVKPRPRVTWHVRCVRLTYGLIAVLSEKPMHSVLTFIIRHWLPLRLAHFAAFRLYWITAQESECNRNRLFLCRVSSTAAGAGAVPAFVEVRVRESWENQGS